MQEIKNNTNFYPTNIQRKLQIHQVGHQSFEQPQDSAMED